MVFRTVQTWWCFEQYKVMHNHSFTHISIVRFIKKFEVAILLNRQLCVNMGKDRGGLLFLDPTVC